MRVGKSDACRNACRSASRNACRSACRQCVSEMRVGNACPVWTVWRRRGAPWPSCASSAKKPWLVTYFFVCTTTRQQRVSRCHMAWPSKNSPLSRGAHRTHAIQNIFVPDLLVACEAFVVHRTSLGTEHQHRQHRISARGNLILCRLYEHLPSGCTSVDDHSPHWLSTVRSSVTWCVRRRTTMWTCAFIKGSCLEQVRGERRRGSLFFFQTQSSAAKTNS